MTVEFTLNVGSAGVPNFVVRNLGWVLDLEAVFSARLAPVNLPLCISKIFNRKLRNDPSVTPVSSQRRSLTPQLHQVKSANTMLLAESTVVLIKALLRNRVLSLRPGDDASNIPSPL